MTNRPTRGDAAGRYYGTVLSLALVFLVAVSAGQSRLAAIVGQVALGFIVLTEVGVVEW